MEIPIILVEIGVIPNRTSGELETVDVYYRFDPSVGGVEEVVPGGSHISLDIAKLPRRQQEAARIMASTLTKLIDLPTTNFLGQNVTASAQFHHIVYHMDFDTAPYYLRVGGRFVWPGRSEDDLHQVFHREDFPQYQQQILDQLAPWAREIALEHAQGLVDDVFRGRANIPRIHHKKKIVMISYRSTEGWQFAHRLFEALGDTNLFIPRLDVYDLDAGDWMQQLDYWIDTVDGFVAIYTPDYENGRVSSQELARALSRTGQDGFVFVPALHTFEPVIQQVRDQNWVDFRSIDSGAPLGTTEAFDHLIELLHGTSTNPHDPGV